MRLIKFSSFAPGNGYRVKISLTGNIEKTLIARFLQLLAMNITTHRKRNFKNSKFQVNLFANCERSLLLIPKKFDYPFRQPSKPAGKR